MDNWRRLSSETRRELVAFIFCAGLLTPAGAWGLNSLGWVGLELIASAEPAYLVMYWFLLPLPLSPWAAPFVLPFKLWELARELTLKVETELATYDAKASWDRAGALSLADAGRLSEVSRL